MRPAATAKPSPSPTTTTKAGQALNRRRRFRPLPDGRDQRRPEAKYGPAPTIADIKAAGNKLPGKKTIGTGAPRSRKAPMKAPMRKAPMKRK
ncbi:MAG: hypothetical protein WKG07_31690 [Hymenobacter sp.]